MKNFAALFMNICFCSFELCRNAWFGRGFDIVNAVKRVGRQVEMNAGSL